MRSPSHVKTRLLFLSAADLVAPARLSFSVVQEYERIIPRGYHQVNKKSDLA
jgi:hypothetical protein